MTREQIMPQPSSERPKQKSKPMAGRKFLSLQEVKAIAENKIRSDIVNFANDFREDGGNEEDALAATLFIFEKAAVCDRDASQQKRKKRAIKCPSKQ